MRYSNLQIKSGSLEMKLNVFLSGVCFQIEKPVNGMLSKVFEVCVSLRSQSIGCDGQDRAMTARILTIL